MNILLGISRAATVDILSANILDSLKNRRQNLELVTAQWPDVEAVIDSAISLGDQAGFWAIIYV